MIRANPSDIIYQNLNGNPLFGCRKNIRNASIDKLISVPPVVCTLFLLTKKKKGFSVKVSTTFATGHVTYILPGTVHKSALKIFGWDSGPPSSFHGRDRKFEGFFSINLK